MIGNVLKKTVLLLCAIKVLRFATYWIWNFAPGTEVYSQFPGECHVIPGIVNGSENMVMTPDGLVLITSGCKPKAGAMDHYAGRKGAVYMYDMKERDPEQRATEMTVTPAFPAEGFIPLGLDIKLIDGKYQALVVNHPSGGVVIERLQVDFEGKSLTRVGDFSSELFGSVNDVAWVSDTEFLFTNFLWTNPDSWLSKVEFLLFEWGSIGVCSISDNSCRLVAHGLAAPNGIVLSHSGKFVYVANNMYKEILVYRKETNNSLTELQRYGTGHTIPDNLYITPNDRVLYTAGHPKVSELIRNLEDPWHPSPNMVLRFAVDPDSGLIKGTGQVLSDPGTPELGVYGSAVTVPYGGRIIIGTISNRAMVCDCGPIGC